MRSWEACDEASVLEADSSRSRRTCRDLEVVALFVAFHSRRGGRTKAAWVAWLACDDPGAFALEDGP